MRPIILLPFVLLASCVLYPLPPGGSIAPSAPRAGQDLRLLLDEGPEDTPRMTHQIRWTVDGEPVPELDDVYTVPGARTAKGQRWGAEVIAGLKKRASEPIEIVARIGNTAPTVQIQLSPAAPSSAEPVQVRATPQDIDGDAVSLRYVWFRDGDKRSEDGPKVRAQNTARGETWRVQVWPSDGESEGEPAEAEVVIENAAPSVAAARVDPSVLRAASVATCEGADWSDPDGDPPRYQTFWHVNSQRLAVGDTLSDQYFDRGDEVACELVPYDDFGEGSSVLSTPVTVGNTPPKIVRASVTPEVVRTVDQLIATLHETYDDDGDFVVGTFRWTLCGELLSTASFLPPGLLVKGDQIRLDVRAFDGLDHGPTWSWTQIVANSPPSAPVLAFEPADPHAGEAVHCQVDAPAFDADGDPVIYHARWILNGENFTGELDSGAWPGDLLPAGVTAPGDEVSCILRADDGEDRGEDATLSAVIPAE